jgi:chromosome segregation ATPase
LESIRPKDGVANLFEAILRDEFNTRNNSAVSELHQAERTLESLQNKKEALLDKLLEGIVSNADYQTHISNLDGKMNEVNARIERLNETDTSIEDFIPFGISLLTNLEVLFE